MSRKLRIVFMGTPDFAVPSLQVLVENEFDVAAVITAPDRPAGRGYKLKPSAVKQYAESVNLPILQPTNLKNPEFIEQLESLEANLFVVVAFRMLPKVVWQMPEYGTFNLHGSLLPQYRGAAPIHWAVINGEIETGVTTFFLKHEIDTGDVILQRKMDIDSNATTGDVHDEMMLIGKAAVLETVQRIAADSVEPIPQQTTLETKHAPKLSKEMCLIDWSQSVYDIHNFVRGLNPYPTAFTTLNNTNFKIHFGTPLIDNDSTVGAIQTDNKTYLRFGCNDGWYDCLEVQLQGKKRMKIADFLRGYDVTGGELV